MVLVGLQAPQWQQGDLVTLPKGDERKVKLALAFRGE